MAKRANGLLLPQRTTRMPGHDRTGNHHRKVLCVCVSVRVVWEIESRALTNRDLAMPENVIKYTPFVGRGRAKKKQRVSTSAVWHLIYERESFLA